MTTLNSMDARTWVTMVADRIGSRLDSVGPFQAFSNSHVLKGAYAEACVRELIRDFVSPMRVSRGTILYEGNVAPGTAQEIDAIVWQPSPLPSLFEAGDFAAVPRGSAVGFLEVKRSNYSNVGIAMQNTLKLETDLVPNYEGTLESELARLPRTLGVICLHENSKPDAALESLYASGRAVKILQVGPANSPPTIDPEGVVALANFLIGLRARGSIVDGKTRIFLPPKYPTPVQGASVPMSTNYPTAS